MGNYLFYRKKIVKNSFHIKYQISQKQAQIRVIYIIDRSNTFEYRRAFEFRLCDVGFIIFAHITVARTYHILTLKDK